MHNNPYNIEHLLAVELQKSAGMGEVAQKVLNQPNLWSRAGKFVSRTAARGVKSGWLNKPMAHMINRGGRLASGFGRAMSRPLFSTAIPIAGMLAEKAGVPHAGMISKIITSPGKSLLASAPKLAQSIRLGDKSVQDRIAADAQEGASRAQQDFISAAQMDPKATFGERGSYAGLLSNVGVNTDSVNSYAQGEYRNRKPLGFMDKMERAISDPQRLVNYGLRNKIQANVDEAMQKEGKFAISPGMMEAGKTGLKWLGRAATAGALYSTGKTLFNTGKNLVSDRPYDRDAVMQEGYAGAQAALAKKLDSMSSFERKLAQFDPGFAIHKLEKRSPGAIAGWEQSTGQTFRPGMLSGIAKHFSDGMPATSYSTGLDGSRTFL